MIPIYCAENMLMEVQEYVLFEPNPDCPPIHRQFAREHTEHIKIGVEEIQRRIKDGDFE